MASQPPLMLEILDFVEGRDEIAINNIDFESITTEKDIREYLSKTNPMKIDGLEHWLKYMCQEGFLIKIRIGKDTAGFRSSVGELARLLYQLKLITRKKLTREDSLAIETEDVYNYRMVADFAQVKFAKAGKFAPARDKSINDLEEVLIKSFIKYQELKQLGRKIDDAIRTVLQTLSNDFQTISSFQELANKEIAKQGYDKFPPGIVITAGTGSGKTLAFTIAPLVYAHLAGLAGSKGTKVLLVYPRNALADDQTSRMADIAAQTSNALEEFYKKKYGSLAKNYADLSKVDVKGDFGGRISKAERGPFYGNPPSILVTNADTLHRRLMDRKTYNAFSYLKFAVFDEVHLYYGYYGTNVINLIRRLKARVGLSGGSLVLVGASATIARPEDFCAKLFSIPPSTKAVKPKSITSDPTIDTPYGVEYHVFLKPLISRPPLSTAIDATSCIIHNRRKDGLLEEQRKDNVNDVSKTIAFADSRDTVVRWVHQINDFERAVSFGDSNKSRHRYEYLRFLDPCCEETDHPIRSVKKSREEGIPFECPKYSDGLCWTLSNDGGDEAWVQKSIDNKKKWFRLDNIWATYKSSTAGISSFNDLFTIIFQKQHIPANYYNLVVATPALEVGVDISNVAEVILYKAIPSPSAYRQKIGRGGREINSRVLATSILANTPQENYYFRHYMSLVSPSYKPVPIESKNLDVARVHATAALVDYISAIAIAQRKDLPDIYYLRDSVKSGRLTKDSIEKLKKEISTSNCHQYLSKIVDEPIADEVVKRFIVFLDGLIKPVFYVHENGMEREINQAEFVTRYSSEKDFAELISQKLAPSEETAKALEDVKERLLKRIADSTANLTDDNEVFKMCSSLYKKIMEIFEK